MSRWRESRGRSSGSQMVPPGESSSGKACERRELKPLLIDETLVGNAPAVRGGVNDGLADGLEPERMLYDALIPSPEEVGARFERGDYFVPEMLIAARAMQGALDILRPLLAESGAPQVGTFLMGTVKGDVHDIGKNLCNIMLEGAGFTVIDLGVNVPPERFVEQIAEHNPDVVGFSAFLTTTMPMFKASADASSAVKKAKELIQLRREKVPASEREGWWRASSTRSRSRSGTAGCAVSAFCTAPG
jgi:methanogenic corrinoid protein MtbC1